MVQGARRVADAGLNPHDDNDKPGIVAVYSMVISNIDAAERGCGLVRLRNVVMSLPDNGSYGLTRHFYHWQYHNIKLLVHHPTHIHLLHPHFLILAVLPTNKIPPITLEPRAQPLAIGTSCASQQRAQLGLRWLFPRCLGIELPVIKIR